VQEQLRHADPRVTLGMYSHVIGEDRRNAVERVATLLRPTQDASCAQLRPNREIKGSGFNKFGAGDGNRTRHRSPKLTEVLVSLMLRPRSGIASGDCYGQVGPPGTTMAPAVPSTWDTSLPSSHKPMFQQRSNALWVTSVTTRDFPFGREPRKVFGDEHRIIKRGLRKNSLR
jgi:hypothetical protein